MLNPHPANAAYNGKVWLVGAGPGDPDLLTVKALRVIEQADLILFDQLVSEEIKALFPVSIPTFYVGKVKGNHSIAQADLNNLLVKKAKEGLCIVRLKGGDPFVFGRGGEELLSLVNAGIDVDVVPGITAASGCAAASRIPLTHRGISQGCTFVTGHAETTLNVNWQALVNLDHTVVFYMGLSNAEAIQNNLISAGADPNTPVAIIENGSRSNQIQIIGRLGDLMSVIHEKSIASPALILVGRVVALAEELNPDYFGSLINKEYLTKCA